MIGFGDRLRTRRQELKLTQNEVADYLRLRNSRSIRQYENEEVDPPLSRIVELAKLYQTSMDYLVGMSDEILSSVEVELLQLFKELPPEKKESALQLLKALK